MKKEKIDIEKEADIIIDFFKNLSPEVKKQLRNFRDVKDSIERVDALEDQIGVWDGVLQQFVFFDEDVDLIGERVKMISESLLERAKKERVSKQTEKILKTDRWVFDW